MAAYDPNTCYNISPLPAAYYLVLLAMEGRDFVLSTRIFPSLALLGWPHQRWSCLELVLLWSWWFAWPPSCLLILCLQWGLLQHMLLPSRMLAQCNYSKPSPPVLSFPLFFILLPRAHFLPVLFCFVFSSQEIGCIKWFHLIPRLHLKDIVYLQNPQLCLCSRHQTSLSLGKDGANPPFASCPAEPLAQGYVVLNNH